METLFVLSDLDIDHIIETLSSVGATSVGILDEDFRLTLLREAETYVYQPEAEVLGSGNRVVRQQVSSFSGFSEDSKFVLLKNSFQALLERCLAGSGYYPFRTALNFDSMVLQRYEEGDRVFDIAWDAYVKVLEYRKQPVPDKPKDSDLRLAFPPST